MATEHTYIIVERWFVASVGWQTRETKYRGKIVQAHKLASLRAETLDAEHGDDHFWTVDLNSPDGSSFFQLFHGRLS
jgi:hypothetical protein